MAEKETVLKLVRVNYTCDKCNQGLMQTTGLVLTSVPPQYPHVCNQCGYEMTFKVAYPYRKEVEE